MKDLDVAEEKKNPFVYLVKGILSFFFFFFFLTKVADGWKNHLMAMGLD